MSVVPTLIVCEPAGAWAPAIRQAFAEAAGQQQPGPNHRLVETRDTAGCLAALAQAPRAVVAIILDRGDIEAALERLNSVAERRPAALPVALVERALGAYRWLARELGAVHVCSSPRQLSSLVELARRHWMRLPAAESATAQERIWNSLPWS